MSRPTNAAGPITSGLLKRLFADAPNLLPRVARLAPGYFSRRLRQPVFLIGCGRSGKTVLAEILGRHPDIALYPGEANQLWHPELYPWRESPHRHRVPPIWFDAVGFVEGSARVRTRRHVQVLRSAFAAYQLVQRRRIFLNESALTSLLVPFILAEFPGAKIIHMVRDGRAVAAAWARRQHAEIGPHAEIYRSCGLPLDFDDVLDRCAASWNAQVLEASLQLNRVGGHESTGRFDVRYEHFCARPGEVLEALAHWLGLNATPLLESRLDHIENRNAADVAGVTPAASHRIEAFMTEGLALLGYLPAAPVGVMANPQ